MTEWKSGRLSYGQNDEEGSIDYPSILCHNLPHHLIYTQIKRHTQKLKAGGSASIICYRDGGQWSATARITCLAGC